MSAWRSWILAMGLLGAGVGCQQTGPTKCVEGVCFDVPAATEVVNDGARHTLRPQGWGSWLDVQRVEPTGPGPTSIDDAVAKMGERYALLGNARVLSRGRTDVGGVDAAAMDVEITRGDRVYRRLIYVLRPRGKWVTIDVTAASPDIEAARAAWQPVLRNARWVQS